MGFSILTIHFYNLTGDLEPIETCHVFGMINLYRFVRQYHFVQIEKSFCYTDYQLEVDKEFVRVNIINKLRSTWKELYRFYINERLEAIIDSNKEYERIVLLAVDWD